jgi:predicted  nucleic acid-binding Zn-ribbon protein
MNELKPEDFVKTLEDWINRLCGGCTEKPSDKCFETCAPYSVQKLIALLREKDATLEMCAETIERQDKELAKKDAEIERLNGVIETMEDNCMTCDYKVVDRVSTARAEVVTEFAERMEKALTAQVNASSNEMLAAFMWCLDLVKNLGNELKGETK